MLKKQLINIYENIYQLGRRILLRTKYRLRIMSPERTIKYIKKHNCSISRYGDGEFNHIFNIRDIGFQKRSEALSNALTDVFDNRSKNLLICLPRCMNVVRDCNEKSKKFWIEWGLHEDTHKRIAMFCRSHTGRGYLFGDSQITRPYMDWKSDKRAKKTFPLLKSLWNDREILIVEGEQTRLGIGNDLFDGAKSIKRVLAPAVGAFEKYDEIKNCIIDNYHGELIILALGPTATVLASDLSKQNMQALDIGHIDIEYEWFLKGVREKVAIEGKYVNEVKDNVNYSYCDDPDYIKQIIARVGL